MLKKNPKPVIRRFIINSAKILFVVEAVGFIGSYAVWHRMNTNRDFRLYMHNNFPWILEGYYKVGETIQSDNKIRDLDHVVWVKENKFTEQ